MSQGRGSGETPPRVTELLKKAVEKTSQSAVAKATDLPIGSIHRYLNGIGEPTKETLDKLAKYFNVSSGWLLGSLVLLGGNLSEEQMKQAYIYEAAFYEIKKTTDRLKTDLAKNIETTEGVFLIMKLSETFDYLREAKGLFDKEEYSSQHVFFFETKKALEERYGGKINNILKFDAPFMAQKIFG